MPASFDNSGKPAYMYDEVGDTWYAFGAKIDTASAYEWTNTQTYLNTSTFTDTVNMLDGFNNFLNPAARDAAITSPVHGTICFVRQDAGGSPLNQIQYYNGSAWTANDGDISAVVAGTGLTGGGTAGSITLNIDTSVVPTLSSANTFTNTQLISANTSDTAFEIRQIGSGSAFVVEDSANPDSTTFKITSDGRTVLGSGNPGESTNLTIDVSSETSPALELRIDQNASPTGSWNALNINGNAQTTGQAVYVAWNWDSITTTAGPAIAGVKESGTAAYMTFHTTTGDARVERMRIDSAGNVNIGAATPAGGGTNTGGLSVAGKDLELMQIMGAF